MSTDQAQSQDGEMRAVWSFWSEPYTAYFRKHWVQDKRHWLSWILSVREAQKHFRKTSLYTDDQGAGMLIEGLGLKFDFVSTALNRLAGQDPKWFALGKLYTYRDQQEAFVHIDSDLFLWKPLPRRVRRAAVVAQNWEEFAFGHFVYDIARVEHRMRSLGGWIPQEFEYYLPGANGCRALNCGVLGGRCVSFLQYYADLAIQFVEHPRNQTIWESGDMRVHRNVIVEQFLLSACIDFHRQSGRSRFGNLQVGLLFDTFEDAFQRDQTTSVGLTHLIANVKTNALVAAQVEKLVKDRYSADYARCMEYCRKRGGTDY